MRRKSPTQPASSSASATAGTTFPQATSTGDVSSVSFIADVVRIGSVPAVAIEPILVAEDTISFYLECTYLPSCNNVALPYFTF